MKSVIYARIPLLKMVMQIVGVGPPFALTGGPSQQDFQAFEAVNTTEMINLSDGGFRYNIPLMDIGGYPLNLFVVIDKKKSDDFIKATPELALKADYYNISKPMRETILILQPNSESTTSDGRYNCGNLKVHTELTTNPAFSKFKYEYILCASRLRAVKAT